MNYPITDTFTELSIEDLVREEIVYDQNGPFSLIETNMANTITCLAGGDEMLKVSPDGFWVRGVKVEQDDNEAQVVYEAFKSWMSWAQLNKDYK